MISKFQKFEAITIHRSMLKNAIYNPRIISDKQAKALRKSIKTHGLVETIIWNRTTGNIVGGHQRLSQLDALERKEDYELTVAAIEIDEKQEKELNIALNNPSLQGEYDFEMLKDIFPDIDIAKTGFTDYDLSIIGVDYMVDNREEESKTKAAKKDIEAIKQQKKKDRDKAMSQGENYIVIVFETIEEKEQFLERLGHETDDRYIAGEVFRKYLTKKDA